MKQTLTLLFILLSLTAVGQKTYRVGKYRLEQRGLKGDTVAGILIFSADSFCLRYYIADNKRIIVRQTTGTWGAAKYDGWLQPNNGTRINGTFDTFFNTPHNRRESAFLIGFKLFYTDMYPF